MSSFNNLVYKVNFSIADIECNLGREFKALLNFFFDRLYPALPSMSF